LPDIIQALLTRKIFIQLCSMNFHFGLPDFLLETNIMKTRNTRFLILNTILRL